MLCRAIALSAIVAVAFSTAGVALTACQMRCDSAPMPVAAHASVSGDADAHMHHAAMRHHSSHAAMTPSTADLLMSAACQIHAACPVAKAKVHDAELTRAELRVQLAGLPPASSPIAGSAMPVKPDPSSTLTRASRSVALTALRI